MQLMSIKVGLLSVPLLKMCVREKGGLGGEAHWRKRLLKGMEGMTLTNPGGNLSPASKSTPKERSRESSSTQSTPASNPKQKRGRITSEHAEQVGTKRAEEAGPSTAASYAIAVRTSNQRLVITRKGSKGDTFMVDSDLRVIQVVQGVKVV